MSDGTTQITRLGHACYRIETPGGKVIVIDPWITGNPSLADPWTDLSHWSDTTHILATHGHFDHITGVAELAQAVPSAQLIAQFEIIVHFLAQGLENVLPTNIGSTIDLGDGLKVSAVSATHSSSATNLETGEIVYLGTAMGFVIELENGFKIYHAGDTGLHADMKFVVADFFKPDLAILPCDGLLTMSPEQAAYAAKVCGVSAVIPSHDFPTPEQAPGMGGFIEAFPFVGMMLGKSKSFTDLMAEAAPDVTVHHLSYGDSVEL